MSTQFIIMFCVTVFAASIIPGPSMLLALSHGMTYGAKRTMASAMGNVAVTFGQASISIVGLGTVLIASESVFQVIKWAGALYLIYMGISMLRSTGSIMGKECSELTDREMPLGKMFFQSAIVTAGNPKAIVFFSAVFPQFIQSDVAFTLQFIVLMGLCIVIAFCCFMLYAIGGQKIVSLFSEAVISSYIKRGIGGLFVMLGVGLALSRRAFN